MIGIYLIRNTITGKVYVGQSINIMRRWGEHKSRAFDPNNNCYDKPLYRSMRKYGVEVFELEVLCECNAEELNELEGKYIAEFNCITPNGYNILPSTDKKSNPNRPIYICKGCGKQLDRPNKNSLCRPCYNKTIRKVERPNKETLNNLLVEHQGNFTQIARMFGVTDKAIRKWRKNYDLPIHSGDYKEKQVKKQQKRSVYQLDKNTSEIIAKYDSIIDAARALGKTKGGHITEVCQGKLQSAFGYKWKYVDEE